MRSVLAALVCLLALRSAAAHAEEPAARSAAPPACSCAEPAEASATVDLNRADEGALLALPGIGPSRARAIVSYRDAHGGFRSLSQLLNIKGIGRSLLRQLRPLVTLSPS